MSHARSLISEIVLNCEQQIKDVKREYKFTYLYRENVVQIQAPGYLWNHSVDYAKEMIERLIASGVRTEDDFYLE